jgi:hypothetical protein
MAARRLAVIVALGCMLAVVATLRSADHVDAQQGPGYTLPFLGSWQVFRDVESGQLPRERVTHTAG